MSDYHVLDGENDGRRYRVAFHISVPNEQNAVSTSTLRAALSEDASVRYDPDDLNPKKSRVPWITVGEQNSLDTGTVYEHLETYKTHPDLTNAQNQAALDARFTQLSTAVVNALRERYAFWRFDRNVP